MPGEIEQRRRGVSAQPREMSERRHLQRRVLDDRNLGLGTVGFETESGATPGFAPMNGRVGGGGRFRGREEFLAAADLPGVFVRI